MNDKSKHPPRPGHDNAASLDIAKRAIMHFLTGQSFDANKMADAVHEIAQQAPDELERLHQAILYGECPNISECLADYLSLGNQASARMPKVHRHLQSCDRCSADLEVLKGIAEQRTAWEVFAQQLVEAESPTLLVLTKQGWQWFTGRRQAPVALSGDDVALGRRIGAWSLRQPLELGFSFSDDVQPPLCLSTSLPDHTVQINLQIIPEYQASQHRAIWRLRLIMDQVSLAPEIHVSIGDVNRQITGTRVLSIARPVEFHMAPPIHIRYQLSFEWRSPQGTWQEYRVELPLHGEPYGRDS